MNERIRQLAEQAGFMDSWFSESGDDCEQELKKFAELIVRECISTLEEKIYRSIDHEGDECWIDLILKEHFGVE
jgi:hypothetical protein